MTSDGVISYQVMPPEPWGRGRRRAFVLGVGLALGALGVGAACLVLAQRLVRDATLASGEVDVLMAGQGLVAGAATLAAAWLALLLLLGAVDALTRPDPSPATPPVDSHSLVTALGTLLLALAVAGPTGAQAAPPGPVATDDCLLTPCPEPVAAPQVPAAPAAPGTDEPPVPGWTPTRPAQPASQVAAWDLVTQAGALRPPQTRAAPSAEVVVRSGDTLWSLATRQLQELDRTDAHGTIEDATVARAWPVWYELNRDVIGSDPDLLLPGQRLRVPDAASIQGQGSS